MCRSNDRGNNIQEAEASIPFFNGESSSAGLIVPLWRGFTTVFDMADTGHRISTSGLD